MAQEQGQEFGKTVDQAFTHVGQTHADVKALLGKVEELQGEVREALDRTVDPVVVDPPQEPENLKPTVTIIKPLAGQVFNNGDTIDIEALAADQDGTIQTVVFLVDGDEVKVERNVPYEATFKVDHSANGGQHTILAVATDNDGAVVSSEELLVVVREGVVEPPANPLPQLAGPFIELEPGLIGFQAEAMDVLNGDDWVTSSEVANAGSDTVVVWEGDDSFETYDKDTALGAAVVITTPGTYQLKVRSKAGDTNDPSKKNDNWVTIEGDDSRIYSHDPQGEKVFAKGNPYGETNVTTANDSSNGALKFYNNNPFDFSFQTSAIDNNPEPIFIDFPEPGNYSLMIGARSSGFILDMVFLKLESLPDSVVDSYVIPGAGGGPVVEPIDPTPVTPASMEDLQELIDSATGDWYTMDPSTLPDGIIKESVIKGQYNATDAFIGLGDRFLVEDVEEMGGERALLMFTPEHPGSGGNYYQRVSVPKSMEYPNARAVVMKRGFFSLKHNRTGDPLVDRRTFTSPPHAKGAGFQSAGGPPQSCSNPISQAKKAELTTLSYYGWQMPVNGLTAKGDQTGLSLPEGKTEWDPADEKYLKDPAFADDRYLRALGAYFGDVYDYKCQSQFFPIKPGTNFRYLFKHGVKYTEYIAFVPNTFTAIRWDADSNPIEWVDNKDGSVLWVLQSDQENGGLPWVAAESKGRSITVGGQMELVRGGIGLYHGGSSKNDYLGVADGNPLANGMWFTEDTTVYLAK